MTLPASTPPSAGLAPVTLGTSGVTVSRLCFGTSKLFRLHSTTERQRLLHAAYDCGIRHFDTARSYGLGCAEEEVGRFARDKAGAVTVATKFGIRLNASGRWFSRAQGIARRVVSVVPAIRKVLKRTGTPFVTARDFDVATARASIETSLRFLGTERIDIVFLHEPDAASIIPDELADLLASYREKGLLQTWGLSGPWPEIQAVASRQPSLAPIVQYACDAVRRFRLVDAPQAASLQYGPFSDAIETIAQWLKEPHAVARWRQEVDSPHDRGTIACLLLAEAVAAPNLTPIVFSTTSVKHLGALVHAAGDPATRDRAVRMRSWLAAQLRESTRS
jgi:D-threo-aldose 1-dehydrogenase